MLKPNWHRGKYIPDQKLGKRTDMDWTVTYAIAAHSTQ